MHIKVERFLTLTAMLASTQVGVVGCGDDGTTGAEPSEDAGRPDVTTESKSSDGVTTKADSGSKEETGELNATLDPGDAGGATSDAQATADADVWGDGGGASVSRDGGSETSARTEAWTDAGGETTWGDTSIETSPDAGDEGPGCYDGDFADEGSVVACATTFGSCEYGYAINTCNTIVTEYRAGIAATFWDCYDDMGVEDPCSENGESAASSCHSFAIENAALCPQTITECEAVADNCNALSVEDCEQAFELYNSGRRGASLDCFDSKLANQAGPDYEGCDYDFFDCVYSPSVE